MELLYRDNKIGYRNKEGKLVEILIVPIKNILDTTNSENYDIAVEMVKEIRQERNTEKW